MALSNIYIDEVMRKMRTMMERYVKMTENANIYYISVHEMYLLQQNYRGILLMQLNSEA